MHWTEIIVKVNIADLEIASAIAQMVVPNGIYIEDYSNLEKEVEEFGPVEMIDDALLEKDKESALIHVYINPEENPAEALAFLFERYSSEKIENQISTKNVNDEDWANNWKKYFKPFEVGDKIVVKPTWEHYENTQGKIILEIDPNMSFGSGQHETTRLCLEMIQRYVTQDTQMLDIGTGSGILAIEAALLGAKSVLAIDIDALSVRIATENALLNNVNDKVIICKSDLSTGVNSKYNLITANIVADIIIRLSVDLQRLLDNDGIFIASGIIDIRENDVTVALDQVGLKVIDVEYKNGWVALAAKRK